MDYKETFKKILDSLELSDEDRESLKSKRGFTDEAIDKLRFKSISEFVVKKDPYLSELPTDFKDAFKQANIIIPYLDNDSSVIHLRPHKFGIRNLQIKPYIPYPVMPEGKHLVIAESEFKAVASCLYGVPSIGIPGIASFSDKHFNLLCDVIKMFNYEKVIICFDNEIKDDSTTNNFKPDFRKRYDTQFYAYIMAKKMNEIASIPTYIATLDAKWMVNNKIDIDGLLSQGVKPETYRKMIDNAETHWQYKKSWNIPVAHRSFIERKIDKYFYDGSITEEFGSYWRSKGRRQELSNFVIKVIHTLFNDDGRCERVCKFFSKYGNSSLVTLNPEAMVSTQTFQKFCFDNGDYDFKGKADDLQALWRYIFVNQDGRIVYKLSYFGYNSDANAWFFSNGAYRDETFYPIDSDNIIWVDDIGYKISANFDDLIMPTLSHERTHEINLQSIFNHIANILNENEAKMIIGWAIGNFFMPEILKTYNIYPFMFLYGKQSAGKSTIANWISSFFGFTMQNGVNFHQSSTVGLSRTTSQMSMIPIWFEEYRNNDRDIGRKNNFLRSIYDKSTIVKGTKRENEIKTYRARSTLIISGEEHPHDAALNSRCVQFPIYRETDTSTISDFKWLQTNRSFFNEIGDMILRNKNTLWPKIKDRIDSYVHAFIKDEMTVSDRQRTQMSIIGGICDTFLEKKQEFCEYLAEKTVTQHNKVMNEQALYVFFDDILNMYMGKKFKIEILKTEESFVFMNFAYAYSEWEIYYRGLRSDIPASKIALLEHLKREPYYVESKQKRIGKAVPYCPILNINHNAFPESLHSILVQMENEKNTAGILEGASHEYGISSEAK